MAGKLLGLEVRDLGELQCLGGCDDGNVLGDLKGLLHLLSALCAEELVDGSLRLLEVAADHADPCHVQDHRDGEGDQADDDVVQAQATVRVGYAHSDAVAFGCAAPTGSDAGVAATIPKRDSGDVQDAGLLNLPLPTWKENTQDDKTGFQYYHKPHTLTHKVHASKPNLHRNCIQL